MRTSGSVDHSRRPRLTGAAARGSSWKTAGVSTAATYTNSHPTRTRRMSMAPVCSCDVSAVLYTCVRYHAFENSLSSDMLAGRREPLAGGGPSYAGTFASIQSHFDQHVLGCLVGRAGPVTAGQNRNSGVARLRCDVGEQPESAQRWNGRLIAASGAPVPDRANPGWALLRILPDMSGQCRCADRSCERQRAGPAGGGGSRFTTWAYRFVIVEVSAKRGRQFWRRPDVRLGAADWEQLPGRFGLEPAQEAGWRDLLAALRRAVDTDLTARQREVFVAIVLNGVPLDAVAARLGSTRNAVYKMMFDARRKLRAVLAANGYLDDDDSGRS